MDIIHLQGGNINLRAIEHGVKKPSTTKSLEQVPSKNDRRAWIVCVHCNSNDTYQLNTGEIREHSEAYAYRYDFYCATCSKQFTLRVQHHES